MKKYLLMAGLCILSAVGFSPGARADDEARQFIDKVFTRTSWKDMQGEVVLNLTNKRGETKVRKIDIWSKRNEADESSMLMRFVEPADVRGTGFLMIEHKGGEDDRRLYLPALRRVNRISASGSGGNFMSSDFTYYDIGRPKLEDWTYTMEGSRTVGGVACKVVNGKAASDKVRKDTGYSRIVWCVDPSRMVVVAADYYDKDDKKFKMMEVLEFEDISGVPFGTRMRMRDETTGHISEMIFSGLKTNQGLSDDIFTERNLSSR